MYFCNRILDLKKKRVVVSVINDLVTDQRVARTCNTLSESGYEVLLIGRRLANSLPVENRKYKTKRMRLLFSKGPFFYFEFSVRLFIKLLFVKVDIFHANDLDTLLPNCTIAKLRKKFLVYDSHEYFTEVPELQSSPLKKKIWSKIEKLCFKHADLTFTVNSSIAEIYENKYKKDVIVLRNYPYKINVNQKLSKKDFSLPKAKKLIILQGSGINIDRGAEEAVAAMQFIENAVLIIAGSGDVIPILKDTVAKQQMKDKVIFIPKLPYEKLVQLTPLADLGLSLDKDTNLNYRYSLPNKLFDYIQASIPIVATPLVEVKRIIEDYEVGVCLDNYEIENLIAKINYILFETPKEMWKNNLNIASKKLCWELEKHKLIDAYEQLS